MAGSQSDAASKHARLAINGSPSTWIPIHSWAPSGAVISVNVAVLPGYGFIEKLIKPHIQSKIKTHKGNQGVVHNMLYGAHRSGFGWDTERKCVTADPDVWDEVTQRHPYTGTNHSHYLTSYLRSDDIEDTVGDGHSEALVDFTERHPINAPETSPATRKRKRGSIDNLASAIDFVGSSIDPSIQSLSD
ncbi:putative myb/SANT-like domain-containing protein [Senna tora]|uniref:Putative myb/SANT-like domain-containing protein n=1 Tax=Senna tora TaxID=362788 RepID=A0A834X1E1_9FABA|nr:putative myb/SANT-like domain-containing protein [Senna tora]